MQDGERELGTEAECTEEQQGQGQVQWVAGELREVLVRPKELEEGDVFRFLQELDGQRGSTSKWSARSAGQEDSRPGPRRGGTDGVPGPAVLALCAAGLQCVA